MEPDTTTNIMTDATKDNITRKPYLVVADSKHDDKSKVYLHLYQYEPEHHNMVEEYAEKFFNSYQHFNYLNNDHYQVLHTVHYSDETIEEMHKQSGIDGEAVFETDKVLSPTDVENMKKVVECKKCTYDAAKFEKWEDCQFKCKHVEKIEV